MVDCPEERYRAQHDGLLKPLPTRSVNICTGDKIGPEAGGVIFFLKQV